MSVKHGHWTRRHFAQAMVASAAVSSILVRGAGALTAKGQRGFAFVGTSSADPSNGSVRVYRVIGSKWQPVYQVVSASPASLLLHPTLPVLYVVHDVETWENLPRGAVSAYAFDVATGRLSLKTTQPLSLAATHPRHAAITADGNALLVSAQTGGIYNLLPIAGDGDLGRVSAIRKEFGLLDSETIASPGHMVLGADSSIFAVDAGQGYVTHFGLGQGGIAVRDRTRVHAGSGPGSICMSCCGQRAYVAGAANGSISVHDVDDAGLSIAKEVHMFADGSVSLVMHPEGRFLIASNASEIQVLSVDRGTGRLTPHRSLRQAGTGLLGFTPDGMQMVGTTLASGEIVTHSFDPLTGGVSAPRVVARESGISSLLLSVA